MFTPGNAFACVVNSHRAMWNGTICREAGNWNCGARDDFRQDYCDSLDPRCFHIHIFDSKAPRFESSEDSLADLVGAHPERLADQILVFYARRTSEPGGIEVNPKQAAAGVYRIRSVQLVEPAPRGRPKWVIVPYEDGWTRFPFPKTEMPSPSSLGLKYARELRMNVLRDLLDGALRSVNPKALPATYEMDDLERLQRFAERLPEWASLAKAGAEKFGESMPPRVFSPRAARVPINTALGDQLDKIKRDIRVVPAASAAVEPPPSVPDMASGPVPAAGADKSTVPDIGQRAAPASPGAIEPTEATVAPGSRPPPGSEPTAGLRIEVPEVEVMPGLEGQFGSDVMRQLRVAFATKPIVILAGPPGMGKSWLATHLLSEARDERSVLVSVGSTWRGREDFIGYVNPISNEFEPSAFSRFLVASEQAWNGGDHRPRLAILEEFNLSQPEHWLSDFLVASQFPSDQTALRTIQFGGTGLRGEVGRNSVYLSPAVRIVATVNNDHTTRPLSPRVLDRAAVVEVRSAVKSIVQLVELPVDDDQLSALEQIDAVLSGIGAGFSVRTALSIRQAHALLRQDSATEHPLWKSIDFVLLQEMLSKVRLLSGEPRDAQLLESLEDWASGPYGARLGACGSRIAEWKSRYLLGADISVA